MKYAIVGLIAVFILSGCVNNRAVPDVEDIDIQSQENNESEKYFFFFYNIDGPPVTIDVEYEITKTFHETG